MNRTDTKRLDALAELLGGPEHEVLYWSEWRQSADGSMTETDDHEGGPECSPKSNADRLADAEAKVAELAAIGVRARLRELRWISVAKPLPEEADHAA